MKKFVLKWACFILSICLLTMSFGSCAGVADPRGDGVLTVVATNFAGYDFARQMLKDIPDGEVHLTLLGKAGQDMHDFEPTAADITALSSADVLICLGSTAEIWLDAALKSAMNEHVIRVEMMAVCETMEEDHSGHNHAEGESCSSLIGADEHVWLSPKNAIVIAKAIGKALCEADAANSERYATAAGAYGKELEALWQAYLDMKAGAVRDTIVIADRYPFAYLMRDLGLTCHAAFPGCSSETSASFATQTFLIEKTKELALPCIFMIEGSDGKVASVVAAETGTEVLTLNSIQVVTDRSVTYIDIMKGNLDALKKALA